MARTDLPALGIPLGLDLRVGLHAGPVFAMTDPVRTEMGFVGEHVTRAARIEPVAPPGAVYVTEAFAALLALETGNFTCEYVGQVPTAKSFGTMPMYLLRRTR
jgi:class 3 adenylate cyclase